MFFGLRRRFHAAVGYGPKTLQRVCRFQRFVRELDATGGSCDLALAAAEAGYADQSHLTRDCAELSGLTPASLARTRVTGSLRAGGGCAVLAGVLVMCSRWRVRRLVLCCRGRVDAGQ